MQHKMPTMPKMPAMPKMPKMPTMPSKGTIHSGRVIIMPKGMPRRMK